MFLHIQVSYNQGMVKTFVAPQETLVKDFVAVARAFGRFRSVRHQHDLDEASARELVRAGNAVMVEARRKQCVGEACMQWRHDKPCCGKDGRSD